MGGHMFAAARRSPTTISPIDSTIYGAKLIVGMPLNDNLGLSIQLFDL